MEKTFKRNLLWAVAVVVAIIALWKNPDHLWTAGIIFALGFVQMEEDVREEGRR